MIPLLYCALADTVVAYVPDDMVFVHEWGVVELDEGHLEAKGNRWGQLDDRGYLVDYYPDEVEAPVVWFHGAACTGDFIVEVTGGNFTEYLPPPDSIDHHAIPGIEASETRVAVWKDIQVGFQLEPPPVDEEEREVEEEIFLEDEVLPHAASYYQEFWWAMPIWREVPSNMLYFPYSDYKDSFLYYECSIIPHEMFAGENYGYEGTAMLFFADGEELVCSKITVPSTASRGIILSDSEIVGELCSWASGGLKSSEIDALWRTWEPALQTRCLLDGETVLVFPLSAQQTEAVSRIRFEPDGDYQVRYDRLFLGIGAL